MKLKNFIKREKREVKPSKNFNLHKKVSKYPNRAEEKTNKQKNKRIFTLAVVGFAFFLGVLLLFSFAYFFNSYIFEKVNSPEIVTPGRINLVDIETARNYIRKSNLEVDTLEYSSTSAGLSAKLKGGPTVFFSNKTNFENQINLLKKIMTTLKLENKDARVVDFRYNRPIVKF